MAYVASVSVEFSVLKSRFSYFWERAKWGERENTEERGGGGGGEGNASSPLPSPRLYSWETKSKKFADRTIAAYCGIFIDNFFWWQTFLCLC